jgi:acyl carrier protein
MNLPVSYWEQWMTELIHSAASLPPRLRLVVVGSEKALPKHLSKWRKLKGAERVCLINAYGPTETTITATLYDAGRAPESQPLISVPIGRPIANMCAYVLDEKMEPMPVGARGELYIGGVGLARGYLNQTELTADNFRPHPFSDKLGARLFRTGDLVRYLPTGNLEFIERVDAQVKVRGFRIELGEVEAALREHDEIDEALVVLREDGAGEQRLVAYVLAKQNGGPALTTAGLRRRLKEKLPEYMLPQAFVLLDAFPLTANGKVNHRALPEPDTTTEMEKSFIAPRTSVEEQLAAMWSKLLGVEHVGIHDNFFDLGGHSLLLTQMASYLRNSFEIELPLRKLFELTTIAELAAMIETGQESNARLPTPAIKPLARDAYRREMSPQGAISLPKEVPDGNL